ncbi:unnamed protein product [Effrenium voratum]|nr:unnamed protein product [Effrenium voratum]
MSGHILLQEFAPAMALVQMNSPRTPFSLGRPRTAPRAEATDAPSNPRQWRSSIWGAAIASGTFRRGLKRLKRTGVRADLDDSGLLWLTSEEVAGEGAEVLELPVLPVEDVHMPGASVTLEVKDVRSLYDSLLLSGSRFVATALFNEERQEMAAVGTLLYLEELRDCPTGLVAEHFAVARVRLLKPGKPGHMEAELLWDCDEENENVPIAWHWNPCHESPRVETRLQPQLGQLERLRGKLKQEGLEEALRLQPPLPRQLRAVQGLWRAKSGVRIRILNHQVVGLGKLDCHDGQLTVQLSTPFTGRITAEGDDGIAETLSWDDGDVWQRLCAPAPLREAPAAAALWRAARRWRAAGALRAEGRRGEARWRSASEMSQSGERPWDPQSASKGLWDTAAQSADAAARTEIWEEVLRPCQRLLQAPVTERIEVLREIMQAEITRLQLTLTVASSDSDSSD